MKCRKKCNVLQLRKKDIDLQESLIRFNKFLQVHRPFASAIATVSHGSPPPPTSSGKRQQEIAGGEESRRGSRGFNACIYVTVCAVDEAKQRHVKEHELEQLKVELHKLTQDKERMRVCLRHLRQHITAVDITFAIIILPLPHSLHDDLRSLLKRTWCSTSSWTMPYR